MLNRNVEFHVVETFKLKKDEREEFGTRHKSITRPWKVAVK